jgi:formylglycine-generating enzyme required for sulfatase activity
MNRIYLVLSFLLILLSACSSTEAPTTTQLPFIETGIDPNSWVNIPAGEFYYGQHLHETEVDYDYKIMVTDVTNQQFADYLNEAIADGSLTLQGKKILGFYPGDAFHGYEHEEEIPPGDYVHIHLDEPGLRLNYDGNAFSTVGRYENHPMVLVTWFGAKAYCDFFGYRLPSEIEWEKAARGDTTRAFPWGDEIGRENANYYSSYDIFEKTLGKGGNTTPVGFYNGSTYEDYTTIDSPSPYGLYDMAGNVWQWTGDVYPDQHYRYMRGGSKDNYAYNLRIWTRNSAGPTYYSPAVGFRCVAIE